MSKPPDQMTDREWAQAFMLCELVGVGQRWQDSIEVLEARLRLCRLQGVKAEPAPQPAGKDGGDL